MRALQVPEGTVFGGLRSSARDLGRNVRVDIRFEIDDVTLHDLVGDRPRIAFTEADERRTIECDFAARRSHSLFFANSLPPGDA